MPASPYVSSVPPTDELPTAAPSRRALLVGAATATAAAALAQRTTSASAWGLDVAAKESSAAATVNSLTPRFNVPNVPGTPISSAGPVASLVATPAVPALPVLSDASWQLLRRATYGPAPRDFTAVLRAGGTTPWLTDQLQISQDPVNDALAAKRFPQVFMTPAQQQWANVGLNSRNVMTATAALHMYRQLDSTRQVYEQTVDALFNHLNVPFLTEGGFWTYASFYNDVIRANAYGKFSDMVAGSIRNGAMLEYLTNAWSSGSNPNENLGRELLELHTVGTAAAFTQSDVRNAAYALTGLSIDPDAASVYLYRPALHYVGPLTVLGWSHPNTTAADGEAVALSLVSYLTHHQSSARRIAILLATRFVSDIPTEKMISDLTAVYLATDTAIVPVLTAMFAHPDFTSTSGTKTKRPAQQAISFARTCGVTSDVLSQSDSASDPTGSFNMLWSLLGIGDALLNQHSPDGLPDISAAWMSTESSVGALATASAAIDGWGAGLTQPSATDLRATGAKDSVTTRWLTTTIVTAGQVVDDLCMRHLGQTLPQSHRVAIAAVGGWDLSAPGLALGVFDAGVPAAIALIAAHPQHFVR